MLVIGQDSSGNRDEVREVTNVVGGRRGVKVRITDIEVQERGVG